MRISNHQALLSGYDFNSWTAISKYKELLSSVSRVEFATLVEEGRAIAKVSLQDALDAVDAAVCAMATAVVMRCSSWLPSSGLHMKYSKQ